MGVIARGIFMLKFRLFDSYKRHSSLPMYFMLTILHSSNYWTMKSMSFVFFFFFFVCILIVGTLNTQKLGKGNAIGRRSQCGTWSLHKGAFHALTKIHTVALWQEEIKAGKVRQIGMSPCPE